MENCWIVYQTCKHIKKMLMMKYFIICANTLLYKRRMQSDSP